MSPFAGKILTGSILAAIGLMTVKFVLALISGTFALLAFLFTTVLPIAIGVWLVVKLVRYMKRSDKPAFE